jgi:hypothetical protein
VAEAPLIGVGVPAWRGRLMLTHEALGPYAEDVRSMSWVKRWTMQAVFEAAAAARSDNGPLGGNTRDHLLPLSGRLLRLRNLYRT